MCVLAAVVASVAGCVGMPANGPTQEFSASATSTEPDRNLIGPFPSGPEPGADPSHIVQGFLIASASYPTYTVARQYLAAAAVKTWNPGFAVTVFSELTVPNLAPAPTASPSRVQRAVVNVTGPVQARFDGSGQYVSAQNQNQAGGPYQFKLVKVGGQWRITNPPSYRMLTADDFPLFYKAQDLYFFDPQDQVLVPDSVFVPLGATVSQLLDNLVSALADGPRTPWLVGATDTGLPSGIKVRDVALNGSAVTVDLAGHLTQAENRLLGLYAAQLVWTLTGSRTGPPAIQSVIVNLNGKPWTPSSAPCPDGVMPSPSQTQSAYQCFDPYPSASASFYYIDRGQSWARCGSESLGLQGLIGSVEPVVGRSGVFSSIEQCAPGGPVHEGNAGPPAAQPALLPAASMTAVSPDGRYLAIVSAVNGNLYVGSLAGLATSFPGTPRLAGGNGTITALSWERDDTLWVVQGGAIEMVPATGKAVVSVGFNGTVKDLSVAPDGVRVAFTAQPVGSQSTGLFLAAVDGGQQTNGQLGSPTTHQSIRVYASLGPNLTDPASITWYDADDLIVLNDQADGNTLWQVPVDGQSASKLQVAPAGVTSITADGPANVLVAGLVGGTLDVSTSLDGGWYPLGNPGQSPAYPS
jgi:hypothetical protein